VAIGTGGAVSKEIHVIRSTSSDDSYEVKGVPVFEHGGGSAPTGSLLAAAAEGGSTNPFPSLGGGYGSSIVFGSRTIGEELDQESDGGLRQITVDTEPQDMAAALTETAEALADREDGDYIVLIREHEADG
jgi:hypothetical protein